MRRGETLQLVGGGRFLLQPVYVDDLCRLLLACAGEPRAFDQIFCVGGPDVLSNADYFRLLGEILGVAVRIDEIPLEGYLEAHPKYSGHLCHRVYSLEKLRAAGLPLPQTSLREGLTRQVEWLLARQAAGAAGA